MCAAQRQKWKWNLTPQRLAKMWAITIQCATATLEASTQRVSHDPVRPLHRRYRTKHTQLRFNHLNTVCYTDTMFSSKKSKFGYTCGQFYVLEKDYWVFYPLEKEEDAHKTLDELFRNVGIPRQIHCDNSKAQTSKLWKKKVSETQTFQTQTEPRSPFQNRAEGAIGRFKFKVGTTMVQRRIPQRLWDFIALYICDIHNVAASHTLKNRSPKEVITGFTPDISELTTFEIYEPCYYFDSAEGFPEGKEQTGRWLGVSHRVGSGICYWVIKNNGEIISRTFVRPVLDENRDADKFKGEIKDLDAKINTFSGFNSRISEEF